MVFPFPVGTKQSSTWHFMALFVWISLLGWVPSVHLMTRAVVHPMTSSTSSSCPRMDLLLLWVVCLTFCQNAGKPSRHCSKYQQGFTMSWLFMPLDLTRPFAVSCPLHCIWCWKAFTLSHILHLMSKSCCSAFHTLCCVSVESLCYELHLPFYCRKASSCRFRN